MKHKTVIICGFVFGVVGFLLMFKLLFLDRIPPEDEIVPGIVVFVSLLNGLLFALLGYYLHDSFEKKGSPKVP